MVVRTRFKFLAMTCRCRVAADGLAVPLVMVIHAPEGLSSAVESLQPDSAQNPFSCDVASSRVDWASALSYLHPTNPLTLSLSPSFSFSLSVW